MSEWSRPYPPEGLMEADPELGRFARAEGVEEWIRTAILEPGGPLYNVDHEHLFMARLAVSWTNIPATQKGRSLAGTAERPNARGSGFTKARAEYQLREWYGSPEPDFIITLFAPWAALIPDASFAALVEHELYHCAQLENEYGAPRFSEATGMPLWTIRGHDVEEFTGVVRRYGARASGEDTHRLVQAALRPPEVAPADVAFACGTCGAKAA